MTTGWLLLALGCGLFAFGLVLPLIPMGPRHRRGRPAHRTRPSSVDVIVPAYLEASVVVSKIRSSKAALRRCGVAGTVIVVASDPDTAAAAVEADVVISVGREGKPRAIDRGVAASIADVCVVTDANCSIEPDDWPSRLLDAMQTNDLLSAEKREQGGSEQVFWLLERLYKRPDRNTETLAVAGEFMAFRRVDYASIPPGTWCDDLWQALDFAQRGLRVALAGGIFTQEPAAPPRDQWARRTRIAQGLFREALPRVPQLVRTSLGRRFLAHKLYRMTLGCLGFWLAVVGVLLILPWWGAVVLAVVLTRLGMSYAGLAGPVKGTGPLASVVGLQSVPPVAALQMIRRSRGASGVSSVGWPKIAR